jgi:hypothetical protein
MAAVGFFASLKILARHSEGANPRLASAIVVCFCLTNAMAGFFYFPT